MDVVLSSILNGCVILSPLHCIGINMEWFYIYLTRPQGSYCQTDFTLTVGSAQLVMSVNRWSVKGKRSGTKCVLSLKYILKIPVI